MRWLQWLRYAVDEECEPRWDLFSGYRGDAMDSTIDALFDFDSTASVASDFEYYSMLAHDDETAQAAPDACPVSRDFGKNDDDDDSSLPPPTMASPSISPILGWTDVKAWINELMDSAWDDHQTSSEDGQQVSCRPLII